MSTHSSSTSTESPRGRWYDDFRRSPAPSPSPSPSDAYLPIDSDYIPYPEVAPTPRSVTPDPQYEYTSRMPSFDYSTEYEDYDWSGISRAPTPAYIPSSRSPSPTNFNTSSAGLHNEKTKTNGTIAQTNGGGGKGD